MKGLMQQVEEIHELTTTMAVQLKDLEETRTQAVAKIFEMEKDLIDLQKAEARDGNFKN